MQKIISPIYKDKFAIMAMVSVPYGVEISSVSILSGIGSNLQ